MKQILKGMAEAAKRTAKACIIFQHQINMDII